MKADRGVLLTVEDSGLEVRANKGEGFHISRAVRDRVLNSGSSVLVRDTSMDDALRERRSIVEQNIRTLMAVPLQTRDQIIGIIYVDSPSLLREFTKDDLSVLTVMANVAAIRIEQTRFAEIEQARQLMARDLEQAAEIQQGFLPSVAPTMRGLDLAGHNAPCRTVGGDYFDFFRYGESRVAMVLGDVSGKGMPASLLMMGLQARVQVLIEEPEEPGGSHDAAEPDHVRQLPLEPLHQFLHLHSRWRYGRADLLQRGPQSADHRAKSGAVRRSGRRAGAGDSASIEYQEYRDQLEEGDCLVIYSDGVTEAAESSADEFETDRLGEAVREARTKPAAAILAEVNRAVAEFTAGAPQSDDITLIVVRRVAV